MQRTFQILVVLVLSVVLVGGVVACAEKSPEEKIAGLRARYTATLNGFFVKEKPAEMPVETLEEGEPVAVESAALEEDVAADEAEGEGVSVEPELKDVLLDFVVRQDSAEKLSGITVEISQADASGAEKAHWRHWVDTSQLEKGPGLQYSHTLEGIDYQEGDGFNVSVRQIIPADELSEYREFDPAGN